jgi:GNAT superfamily N-acetyltransferase
MTTQELPAVQLYSIGPEEADHAAPLLTTEAVEYIKAGEAFGMALVEDGEARAAACARLLPENETILELISLYVAPAFRRRNLGGTLLMELLEETMEATDGSIQWVVSTFAPALEGVEALLSKAGFQMEQVEQAATWQVSVAELMNSELLNSNVSIPAGYTLHSLEELSDYSVRQLVLTLKENWIDDLTAAEMRQALQKASYVLLDHKSQPVACAVFSAQSENSICLSQFFTAGGNAASAMAVLRAAAQALSAQFPGDTQLEIPTLTASSASLVKRLLPSSRPTPLLRAVLDLAQTGEA